MSIPTSGGCRCNPHDALYLVGFSTVVVVSAAAGAALIGWRVITGRFR